MTAFWLYAGLLFAAALAFILVPQLHLPRGRVDASRTRLNVGLYRERLRELQAQHGVGALDAVQLEVGRVEAARELLDDTRRAERAVDSPLRRTIPLAAALSMPLLALALYLHWGSLDQLKLTRQRAAAQNVEKITMRLEAASLAATSDSAEGWSSLGRAYMAQGGWPTRPARSSMPQRLRGGCRNCWVTGPRPYISRVVANGLPSCRDSPTKPSPATRERRVASG